MRRVKFATIRTRLNRRAVHADVGRAVQLMCTIRRRVWESSVRSRDLDHELPKFAVNARRPKNGLAVATNMITSSTQRLWCRLGGINGWTDKFWRTTRL